MEIDQRTLNLAAAAISAAASLVSLGSALFGRNKEVTRETARAFAASEL